MNEDIEMQSTSESVAVTASEEERQKVVDFLQNVLDRMGFDCGVESGESGDALLLNIVGNDASAVIGHLAISVQSYAQRQGRRFQARNSGRSRLSRKTREGVETPCRQSRIEGKAYGKANLSRTDEPV